MAMMATMVTATHSGDLLSVPEAARLSGIPARTLRRRIREGRLPALQAGPARGRFRVRRIDLARFLARSIVRPEERRGR